MLSPRVIASQYAERGPWGFTRWFSQCLGLPTPNNGERTLDAMERSSIRESSKPAMRTEEVSLLALAQGLISPYPEEISRAIGQCGTASSSIPLHAMEAATDVTPSAFANISAYNAAVIGLLEMRILQAYQKPTFMLQNAVEVIPSKLRSLKLAGVSNIGDVAQDRDPGQTHARANLSERFTTTPITKNKGIGVDVTREAVLFDYTAQVLKQADSVGESLALRKEYQIVDCVIGVTNSYNYNGTTYNTYQDAAADGNGGNFINSFVNPITTSNAWDAYNKVLQAWVNMVDPETGQPISLEGFDILAMPAAAMIHEVQLQASEISRMANALTGTYWPQDAAKSTNPARGMFRLMGGDKAKIYPYAFRRATDASGLALSTTPVTTGIASTSPAGGLWFAGDFKKAFNWNENLPLTITRANVNDYVMGDRGIVMALFADEMGAAGVTDPRYVTRNKAA